MRRKPAGQRRRKYTDLFSILMEGADGGEPFLQLFWARGGHMGEAADKAAEAGTFYGETASLWPLEADPCPARDLPPDAAELGRTGVFTCGARHYFPPGDLGFRIPRGVILSGTEGSFDSEELSAGFVCSTEEGLFRTLCAVPDGDLADTFLALAEALPDIAVSWIEFLPEWDSCPVRQFFACEKLNTPGGIRSFLRRESAAVLENGLVKFTVYGSRGQTNLVITDHKEIEILTYCGDTDAAARRTLGTMKLTENDDLKTVSHGLYHWHCRPAAVPPRSQFIETLTAGGFSF